ncbi:MAG: hypothetical protein RLZZ59_587 [Pseudomonadota bacterium]
MYNMDPGCYRLYIINRKLKMKKLLLLASITALSASAYGSNVNNVSIAGDDLNLRLLGRFNFQTGYLKQSKVPGISQNVSAFRKNFGFNSNAFLGARITAERDIMTYGAQLSLVTSARATGTPMYDRSHIFIESKGGKIEAGSNLDVGAKMRITALDIARATGDDSSNYAATLISAQDNNPAFPGQINSPMYPSFFLDNLNETNGESARKVSYYTPEFGGFQVGLSYIPDTSNLGGGTLKDEKDSYNIATTYTYNVTDALTKNVTSTVYSEKKPIKDAYSFGVSFKHQFTDLVGIKLAATGECGKPAQQGEKAVTVKDKDGKIVNATTKSNYKLAKLSTYNIGGIVTIGNYSLAASYANLGDSMTSSEVLGKKRNTKYYTAGVAYSQGPAAISLSYSKADQFGNKMDIYTLGTDYKLAPGLLPYAEIALFNGKSGLPAVYKSDTPKQKFKGMAFILGAKLEF